jgi:hypothetical protein
LWRAARPSPRCPPRPPRASIAYRWVRPRRVRGPRRPDLSGRSDAYLSDPAAIDLIDSLTRTSPAFEALWHAQAVRRTDTDVLQVNHQRGRLTLTLVNLQGVATPGIRFNAYLPADKATAERLVASVAT